ncbi:MAG: hypothetical protein COU40_01530 [Candidatus Moranbacteria bacterium CG10_big_fil_rev_8_21_14_0_10_35_21]|nr:MAG: hypothetical protein COU40_01530 [Candidatus Moranbacteria bacterium CG10_big_fil_rev_8_21_14_0_10_35_21]PJA88608.1 MAG: hypothetical protein CO139_02090 [Candidatus Moranbacteria bacterium CG_4_9_14_3_um_filter_36_9]
MTAEKSMRFLFKGVTIDSRTEEYIIKRLSSLEKLNGKIIRTEVEIDRDKKGKFRAEVMIKTPTNLYRVEETTESIEGSIDIVENELKIQIRRDKERKRTLQRRGARSIKKSLVVDEKARF